MFCQKIILKLLSNDEMKTEVSQTALDLAYWIFIS